MRVTNTKEGKKNEKYVRSFIDFLSESTKMVLRENLMDMPLRIQKQPSVKKADF